MAQGPVSPVAPCHVSASPSGGNTVAGILKFFGGVAGFIFLIGLIVVIGLLMLIF
jgi:hypothetical protein